MRTLFWEKASTSKKAKQKLTKQLPDVGKKTLWSFQNMYFHDDSNKSNCVKSLFRCTLQYYIEQDFYKAQTSASKAADFIWALDDLICSIIVNKIRINV